jgi:RHS repeat-associated protein
LGNITTLAYTTGGFRDLSQITRLYRANDANDDIVTAFTYDATGFLTSQVEDSGTGRLNLTTRYTPAVGGRGLVQTTTSPRGIVTSYTYNPAGQQLTQSTPLGTSTTATVSSSYDNRGNRLSQTDANGNQTSYSYDSLGRLLRTDSPPYGDVSIVGPLPTMHSTNAYDISGNLLTTTLNDGRVTRTGYDRRQRQVRVTAADGTYTLMSYDATGNKVSETDSLGRIKRFLYDARNRLVATVHPDGSTERIRVDGGGRVVANVDQVGATSLTSYDKLGRKVREAIPDPDGAGPLSAPASAWGYDSRGNLEFETRFFVGQGGVLAGDLNRSSQFSYDALGRKIREIQPDPDGSGPLTRPVTSWTYDADGNLLSLTDPRGFITSYTVDALGRKTSETTPDPDGSGPLLPLQTGFVYDRAGNLRYTIAPGGTSESDISFTTEYIYDQLNRLIRTVSPDPDRTSEPLSRPEATRSYNASGFLESSTDALGRTTSFVYDRLGRVLAETNALGGVTRSTYDAAGNRVSTTDKLGRSTFTTYDAMNRVLEVRAPRASSTAATPVSSFVYDATGNLISSTDALGRRRWQQFDALGRLTSQTNALGAFAGDPGATIRNEYDAAGRLLATTDELGRRTEMVYDNLGRRIRLLAPDAGLGRPTTYYGYDAAGNLRFSTDPRGASAGDPNFTTWLFYDALGRATDTVDALGADWAPTAIPDLLPSTVTTNVTRNVYDNRGRLASSTDALARTTNYTYDNLGRLVAETAPAAATGLARAVSRYGYDAAGNRTSETDPLGFVTSYTYDDLDRLTTVTDARGLATVTSYDARGNILSVKDASGNRTLYSYDRLDRLIGETDALGALSSFAYDLAGNRVRQTDRLGRVTSFVYDAANRQVEERWQQAASGSVAHSIEMIYDAANQLLGVIETDTANPAASIAWQFSYDALGNRTKSRMAPGEIVQTPAFGGAQNPPGSLAATDPTIDWDGDGKDERYDGYRITLAVGEQLLLTASSTAFDPVLFLQKPSGGLATALFDDHSGSGTTARLLVTADVAGTWGIFVTSKEENAAGSYDLQIVKDQNAIVPKALVQYDFSYDKAGNLLSTTENQAAVADVTGLGARTRYTIDALNRVTLYEQSNSAGAVSKRVNYTYRGDGSVSNISRFAGAGVNPIGTTTNSYDGMGRLTANSQAPSASAAISYGYSYDAASRITSMTTPEGTSNFTLDATDQLLAASLTAEAYAYDSSGNRTSGGTITGTGNRLLFDGTYRYAYDAEGNRTAKYIDRDNSQSLSVNDTDVTSYGYDQRNRLVAVSHGNLWTAAQAGALANFSSSGISLPGSDLELRYSYDFADRRIRRSIDADGMAGVGGASVFYAAYAGAIRTLEIAQIASYEVNGRIEWVAGEVAQRNFYGNGVDEILAVELNGNTFWTLGDHQDSVRDIVAGNGASRGQLVEHRQYDSFGKIVRRTTGPAASAPTTEGVGINFGYAGRPLEARTGLSDNRARWYEPGTGKFINEDPSGFKGGDANLYRYVGNDPLDQVDPSGLAARWSINTTAKDVSSLGSFGSSSYGLSSLTSTIAAPQQVSSGSRPMIVPLRQMMPKFERSSNNSIFTYYADARRLSYDNKPPVFSELDNAAFRAASGAYRPTTGFARGAPASLGNIVNFKQIGVNYAPTGGFQAALTLTAPNTYKLAYAGTSYDNWDDTRSNVSQLLFGRSTQHEQAIQLAKAVKAALPPKANLILTGHSLGGGLASAASFATGLDAITFNPASLHSNYRQGSSDSIVNHIIPSDPLNLARLLFSLKYFLKNDVPGKNVYHPDLMRNIISDHNLNNFEGESKKIENYNENPTQWHSIQ